MIISELKKKKPGFYELSINHEIYIVTEESVLKYRLFKGYEISQGELEQCLVEDSFSKIKKKAFIYAVKYLKNSFETLQYLTERGIPFSDATRAVEELEAEGKLKEQELANRVAASLARNSNGPYMIRFKLKNRQFSAFIIEEALSTLLEEDIVEGKDKIIKKANTRYKSLSDNEKKRKIKELLYRHGYESF